jgi:hypothetical protein
MPDTDTGTDPDDYTTPPDVAPLMPEPDDHTTLVVRDRRDRLRVIWRDDTTAARCRTARTPADAHWFDGGIVPATWSKILDGQVSPTIAVYDLLCTATPWQASRDAATVFASNRPGRTDMEVFSRTAMRTMPFAWQRQFAVLADQYRRRHTDTPSAALNVGDEVDDLVALVGVEHRARGFSGGHGAGSFRGCAAPLCCQANLVDGHLFPQAAAARTANPTDSTGEERR